MTQQSDRSTPSRRVVVFLTLLPTLMIVGGVLSVVGFSPELREGLHGAWGLLMSGDPDALRDWMLGFGVWAPVISGLLQVAGAIFPPGPSFVLAIANAMLFGFFWGGLLTLSTQIVAALACFWLARVIGRPGVARIVRAERLDQMDAFMGRHGRLAVFIGRIVPFINPDLLSYAAGVSSMPAGRFATALAAGAVPSVLFYSFIGASAFDLAPRILLLVVLASSLPLLVLIFFARRGDGLRGLG